MAQESRLAEIEERYRLVSDAVTDGIVMLDRHNAILWANPAGARMLKASSPDEVQGRSFLSFLSDASRGMAMAEIATVFAGRQGQIVEYEVNAAGGRLVWIEASGTLTRYEGEPAVLLMMRETTDRHREADQIRETQRTLFTLMSNLPGMAYRRRHDRMWTMEFVSEGCFPLTGYHSAELYRNIGVSYASIINPEDLPNVEGEVRAAVIERRPYRLIYRITTRQGEEKWLWERGRPIFGSDGKDVALEGFVADITEQKRMEVQLQEALTKEQQALEGIVEAIGRIVEKRDPYTAGHQRRVARLACAIAAEMGRTEEFIKGLHFSALIHDIGKIYVPSEILSKPSVLNELEYGIVKTHTVVGYECLRTLKFPWPIADVVLQHHERMDGSGYPNGLKGEQIILEARIVAVADAVESIASHRPYRPAFGLEPALEALESGVGKYDAEIVAACLRLFRSGRFSLSDDSYTGAARKDNPPVVR